MEFIQNPFQPLFQHRKAHGQPLFLGRSNHTAVERAEISTFVLFNYAVPKAIVAFYVYEIVYCWHLQDTGVIKLAGGAGQTQIKLTSLDFIMTMISCGVSVVSSIVGVILGFINYDRTYRKKDSK